MMLSLWRSPMPYRYSNMTIKSGKYAAIITDTNEPFNLLHAHLSHICHMKSIICPHV